MALQDIERITVPTKYLCTEKSQVAACRVLKTTLTPCLAASKKDLFQFLLTSNLEEPADSGRVFVSEQRINERTSKISRPCDFWTRLNDHTLNIGKEL